MKFNFAVLLCLVSSVVLYSCAKNGKDLSEPAGGNLPTKYIIINSGSFDPVSVTAVRGNTFTFVNHSGAVVGVYSSDSTVINKQNIADNSSFVFSKDTTGMIIYRMAGKPSVTGSITITP